MESILLPIIFALIGVIIGLSVSLINLRNKNKIIKKENKRLSKLLCDSEHNKIIHNLEKTVIVPCPSHIGSFLCGILTYGILEAATRRRSR